MKSDDLNAFDITQEPESMTELYGASNFGQGCLLARRLIENKVRYVEVTRGGWDTHNDNFNAVANNCLDIDKALSGLLLDLEMRGLLKETMVVLTSEFGRTPNINGRDGRDHWPYCFTALVAGAGVRRGYVHGKSDATASAPLEDAVHPTELLATIYHACGIHPETIVYNHLNQPRELVKAHAVTKLFG